MGAPGRGGGGVVGRRRTPRGPRAVTAAAILSLLVPGLGHAWVGRFARALIWFGGAIVIAVVLSQGTVSDAQGFALSGALGVASAVDIAVLMWAEGLWRASP